MDKTKLKGEITIPSDKSMSHRSLIFASLLKSKVKIKNLSLGEDCISTLKILEKLGIKHEFISKRDLILDSTDGFKKGEFTLDCGNSGTTTRLLSGLLAGQDLKATLIGDKSLSKRPMKRIIEPLEKMGAKIASNDGKLPLKIEGTKLNAIEYHSPIPSAQVKSCLMLAGLNAEGITTIWEKTLSRNHSEIMFEYLGAKIETGCDEKGYFTKIQKSNLTPKDIEIVGDISSAAFFMVGALIIPESEVLIKNVGINPTRTGILDVFEQTGADFELLNQRKVTNEMCADILVKYTKNLKPFKIEGDLIPRLIDEIPILAVLASKIKGKSTIHNAKDLRNKESDRISSIVQSFKLLGIKIEEFPDGFEIDGSEISNCNNNIELQTHLDHRLAMSYYILSKCFDGEITIKGFDCTNTSFPEFLELMEKLSHGK